MDKTVIRNKYTKKQRSQGTDGFLSKKTEVGIKIRFLYRGKNLLEIKQNGQKIRMGKVMNCQEEQMALTHFEEGD